ncbi:MAG: hypothetical protein QM751_12465 [Paludibacteraceae bacterium]
MVSTELADATFRLKCPSMLVTAPFEVPFSITETPIRGSLSSEEMIFPEIVICPKEINELAARQRVSIKVLNDLRYVFFHEY